jgi:hypothetical protein
MWKIRTIPIKIPEIPNIEISTNFLFGHLKKQPFHCTKCFNVNIFRKGKNFIVCKFYCFLKMKLFCQKNTIFSTL